MSQVSQFFSLLVVGENPDDLLKKYDSNIEVEPYIKYKYDSAGQLKKNAIKLIKNLIENYEKAQLPSTVVDYLQERLKHLKSLSDFEYYATLTDGMEYDENGNATSTENPDGKWETCRIGRNLCIPLHLKTGEDVFTAKVKDVDWEYMNNSRRELYTLAWKLCHDEVEPKNEEEENIYNNLKTQTKYFENFSSMKEYVDYNTAYWNNAYLDKNGWSDSDEMKNFDWITKYYKKFIKPLDPEETVTVYECTKPRKKE